MSEILNRAQFEAERRDSTDSDWYARFEGSEAAVAETRAALTAREARKA